MQDLVEKQYDKKTDEQFKEEFIDFDDSPSLGLDDGVNEVFNVYPVYIPEVSASSIENVNEMSLPYPEFNLLSHPEALYTPKLGEQSPTFPSKLSSLPPVYQPEYLEHSPVFYYALDNHFVNSDKHGDGDSFTIQSVDDAHNDSDLVIDTNSVRDNEFNQDDLSINSVSDIDFAADNDVTTLEFCSPRSCLSHSPHNKEETNTPNASY